LKGSDRNLIEVLSRQFPEGSEEIHEKLQSGYPVSRPGFESITFQIRQDLCHYIRLLVRVAINVVQEIVDCFKILSSRLRNPTIILRVAGLLVEKSNPGILKYKAY
jgi:hypothetical protein